MGFRIGSWLAPVAVALLGHSAVAQTVLDDFEDLTGWSATASAGASVEIARDTGHTGMGMRIDFDLQNGGFVIARKAFAISLPANYAFKFDLRGEAPPNNLEFKLVDRSGDNVWWYNQRGFSFPADWEPVTIKKRRIEFAWGPAGGGPPKHVAYIEIAISAGRGGKGSVWIDNLRLDGRAPTALSRLKIKVRASTSVGDDVPEHMLDADPNTCWRSGSVSSDQWVILDFVKTPEYGGLIVDWDAEDYATAYQVQVSDDGEHWTTVYRSTKGNGGRDYVYMPDAESRYLRLELEQSSRGQGYAIRTLSVQPFEFSASPNQFFEAIARDAPAGTYPKYFSGKQTYWTVVGVSGDDHEALLNEEGVIEVDKGGFTIEPFLYADGALITWNDVRTTQTLADGYLPVPSVTWQNDRVALRVTAFAAGLAGASTLYARYRVDNTSDARQAITLFLAIRPFQVLPPWQSLNMVGGVTQIRDLTFEGRAVWVNLNEAVVALTAPDHFGAATFEEGQVTDFLREDKVPLRTDASDPFGYASGALQFGMNLDAGAHHTVDIALPYHAARQTAATLSSAEDTMSHVDAALAATTHAWERTLDRVEIQLPNAARKVTETLKSTLAYILINRDGPAIHPGPRTYARSWIRDGAMTSAALLEMGFTEEPRDFIRWFAQYQLPDGRVPCCVDQRGADPVPEYDSNGEFIYAVAEYYRYTRDIGFLSALWPQVVKAVESIAALRAQRTTETFTRPDKRAYYGLMPESISHEGYASHPVHSYWDDFFALRGLKDAAMLAVVVGDDEHSASFAALRDAFRHNLYASMVRTIADRKLDYVPASVELGDFDPTSTAIALVPGGELPNLPEPMLRHMYDQYFAHVEARERGEQTSEAYTPYELRNVDAFIRLGQRDRAVRLLADILADQRPPAWNQWPEILWRDPTAPRFLGDLPHTWVGSSFIRAVRSMFVYEREADRALVLAAGLPASWVMSESGVAVKRLPTYYGVLSYSLRPADANHLQLRLSGDLFLPPGHIVIEPPLPQPLTAVTVNGVPVQTFTADTATVTEFPAEVILEYNAPNPAGAKATHE